MSERDGGSRPTRRGFLAGAGLAAATAAAPTVRADSALETGDAEAGIEPFWGVHQGGIDTPPQGHTYFAAFDLTTEKRDAVVTLLKAWTAAAARMTSGLPIEPFKQAEV